MKKIILGFVGEIASGKGEAIKYLIKHRRATTIRFSSSLRDILNRLHLEISRKNLQRLSTIVRKNFGEDLLAKIVAADVAKEKSQLVAVDGIRRIADVKHLLKLPYFQLIYLTADPKIRFQRIINRRENQGDAKKTWSAFQKEEKAEAERQIKNIAKKCDFIITNNGSKKELFQEIENLLNKISKRKINGRKRTF